MLSQRGRARARRAAAVALACAAAAWLAGCGGGGGERPSAQEVVSATSQATAKQTSFRFTLEVRGVPPSATGLSLTHADGAVVVPDRLQAKVAGTFARIPIASELVIVGGRDYFKDPLTGRWRTLDIATSPVALFDPRAGVLAVVRRARELAIAGEESVGGVDTYHLRGKVRARDAAPLVAARASGDRLVELDLWVGKDDDLLRRVRVSGPIGAGEPAGASRTVELRDFGRSFGIEAPATG